MERAVTGPALSRGCSCFQGCPARPGVWKSGIWAVNPVSLQTTLASSQWSHTQPVSH